MLEFRNSSASTSVILAVALSSQALKAAAIPASLPPMISRFIRSPSRVEAGAISPRKTMIRAWMRSRTRRNSFILASEPSGFLAGSSKGQCRTSTGCGNTGHFSRALSVLGDYKIEALTTEGIDRLRLLLRDIDADLLQPMASGRIGAGSVPAENTSNRSPASCRKRLSAIWLRAELPVHTISSRARAIATLPFKDPRHTKEQPL